jgi:hypothetical protein
MPMVTLTDEQVIELVKQLPLQSKYEVLKALNAEREAWWERTLTEGEQQLRRLCAERGLEWDIMSEDEREVFVDDLIHEDR